MLGYFVPVFEQIYKNAIEKYQEINFEEDTCPQEFLIKIEVKNG